MQGCKNSSNHNNPMMLFSPLKPNRRFVAVGMLFLAVTGLQLHAATYYVSDQGNDGIDESHILHDGSQDKPWKTVAYAASRVKTPLNTIQVGPGIFAEAAEIVLAPGIDLTGSGQATTIITTTGTRPAGVGDKLLVMRSSSATDGNQTISHLTLDGKANTVSMALHIQQRNNVTIHDVTVKDCRDRGVLIEGLSFQKGTFTWPDNMPTTGAPDKNNNPTVDYWTSNLQIYDSSFLNSGLIFDDKSSSWGALTFYQLRDSEIHHCTFDETDWKGFNLKGRWGLGLHIHDNIWRVSDNMPERKPGVRANAFGFECMEMWSSTVENNWSNGVLSLFAANSFIQDNDIVVTPGVDRMGIEISGPNTYVRRNYIDGAVPGITYWGEAYPNLYIEQNVIRGGSILISAGQNNTTSNYAFTNIFIWNNTIDHARAAYNQGAAIGARIQFPSGSITGLDIRNNIITNTDPIGAVSLTGPNGSLKDSLGSKITGTILSHNLFFNTSKSTIRLATDTPPVNDTDNIAGSDPLYVGGDVPDPFYRLQPGSPAINRGVNVGLTYVGAAPDIGAYETTNLIPTRYEAETTYTVPDGFDVGTSPIGVRNRALDSGTSVSVYDSGDTIRIPFTARVDGRYTLKVRLRSGGANNTRELYWPNGYSFVVDGTPVTLTGDRGSISEFDANSDGGVFWGTMQSLPVPLAAGAHTIDIRANYTWGMIDYLEVVE